ncbi:MAG: DUF4229 domain-containing protein [Candidatus Nanopelagicales bacterium]
MADQTAADPQGSSEALDASDQEYLAEVRKAGHGHPFVLYTAARIALFVGVGAVLYLIGARGLVLLLFALLVSGLLSFVLLGRLRDAASLRYSERSARRRERQQEKVNAEDDIL